MLGHRFGGGWVELIVGPMFSGKSEGLIRRVTRASMAKPRVQAFKHSIDVRDASLAVASRARRTVEAQPVAGAAQLLEAVEPDTQVVAVDEAQCLDDGVVGVVERLADARKRVILAG